MTVRLYEFADRQADERPEALAVTLDGDALTYAELATSSNRLANLLDEGGCEPGDRVAIIMPKSPTAVMAMHGIMKAGCAYVPVDAESPVSRVRRIIEASEPRWIVAAGSGGRLLDELLADGPAGPTQVGWLDADSQPPEGSTPAFDRADLESMPASRSSHARPDTEIAHLLFTSGSTGVPKGVVIEHANVIAFVEWAVGHFGMAASDRVSGHSPLHFDLSSFDIYGAFAAGAELHLVPPGVNLMAPKLAAFIRRSRLTQWFSVPSILTYLATFDVVEQDDFPELERLLWCGEVFPTPALMHWMERLPHVTFTNLYGPTEATIASSYHTLEAIPPHPAAAVPIGRACGGEELLVLDDQLAEVAVGTVADLHISGVGLSPGYWRDPEATAAAFRTLDDGSAKRIYRTGDLASVGEDGLVYFHGRADTQIKSRGHRIELGEIETALGTIGILREHAVVAIASDGFEGSTICCAYVPAQEADVSPRQLRSELLRLVPSYMVPSRWLELESLPKNANGKIDRPTIRDRFGAAA